MRIRCASLLLPEVDLPPSLAAFQGRGWRWPVDLHREYRVLALHHANGVWYALFEYDESEMPVSAPLALFDVVDATVSPIWNVRVSGPQLALQPEEFDDEFFSDDVQERRGDALQRYRALKARLGP
ncbi:MAG: hypothetical protein JWP97_1213 [Labilithrix sp.]|nr:hypothetical protein [Labilithrix sp.]